MVVIDLVPINNFQHSFHLLFIAQNIKRRCFENQVQIGQYLPNLNNEIVTKVEPVPHYF